MNANYITVIAAFLGGALGFLGALYSGKYIAEKENKRNLELNASMLYYDLKSIDEYFKDKSASEVNIRYGNEWQRNLAHCSFLSQEMIMNTYYIYDYTYDYNEKFLKSITDGNIDEAYEKTKEKIQPLINKVIASIKDEHIFKK